MADVENQGQRAPPRRPFSGDSGASPAGEPGGGTTVVAAMGTFEDLDFDTVSDLRLAVDEACTRLIRSAVPRLDTGARGSPA